MAVDKNRLYKKLEHVGEQVVRENLANDVYGPNRRPLVEEWLEQFDDTGKMRALDLAEREEEDLGFAREADPLAQQDRQATPEKWYRRHLGVIGLAVLAGLIIYLISFFAI